MQNGITKKDLMKFYNVNRWILAEWLEPYANEIGIKKTKQTFTPRQIKLIVQFLGFPPYTSDSERRYLSLICT